jgi:hypothetical protein
LEKGEWKMKEIEDEEMRIMKKILGIKDLKFCKDCKYCSIPDKCERKETNALCMRYSTYSPVMGELRTQFCYVQRSIEIGECGPDAQGFDPKENGK